MQYFWQMVIIASMLILGLSACEPKVAERGKFDLAELSKQIEPKKTTRSEIVALLGSPSAKGQFADKAWYYVSQRKEGHAFFASEVVDSQVLRVNFKGNIVTSISNFNNEDVKRVEFSDNETPTAGQEYGFVEQLLGNIGKFNKQRDSLGP